MKDEVLLLLYKIFIEMFMLILCNCILKLEKHNYKAKNIRFVDFAENFQTQKPYSCMIAVSLEFISYNNVYSSFIWKSLVKQTMTLVSAENSLYLNPKWKQKRLVQMEHKSLWIKDKMINLYFSWHLIHLW